MKFDEYLNKELSKPVPSWCGNEPITSVKSNSTRSIVTRMRVCALTSLKWEFKLYLHNFYDHFTDWDGIDTPISWFIFVLLSPLTITFLPPITAILRYKSAINCYKREYNKEFEEDI